MKVKKPKLLEKALTEANDDDDLLSEIDPSSASTAEIADALQNTLSDISDGKTSMPDSAATAVAKEVKQAATEVDAGAVAIDNSFAANSEEALKTTNKLTEALDKTLASVLKGRRQHRFKSDNVLVIGLPGSAKTAITLDWAKANNINLFVVTTTDVDLDSALNGITLRDMRDKNKNKVTKAYSDYLDKLDRPNSVLFIDEYNRGPASIRVQLLNLINGHYVAYKDNEHEHRYFDNLLFTVACINPGGNRTDRTADALSSAELGRFSTRVEFDSNTAAHLDFVNKYWKKEITKLDPKSQYYLDDLEEYLRKWFLTRFILEDADFRYNVAEDEPELYDEQRPALSQRSLTNLIDHSVDGKVTTVKETIENYSGYSAPITKMLLDILDRYKEPTFQQLLQKAQVNTDLPTNLLDNAIELKKATGVQDDAEEEAAAEELEDDDDFFASPAGGKSIKTAADVEAILQASMDEWTNA